jgi:dTDP-4-dehydrorhamnose reductase
MNVVILGANGQLGRDLTKVLTMNTQLNVIGLSRDKLNANLDLDNLNSILSTYQPDIIINCIAITHVDWCELNPQLAWQVNTEFVYRLAQFCSLNQVQLIHLSTDYVFDGCNNNPYLESDKAQPLNIYGITKYAAELLITSYMKKFFIFRVSGLFGSFGASGKGGNFITSMTRLAQEKNTLSVVNDQISNPTATMAVARCIEYFIAAKITDYGVYHCVSANSCSWYDFACKILELFDLDVSKIKPVSYASYPFKAKRPQYSVLSTKKLSNYYQMPSWEDGLLEYVELVKKATMP